MSNIWYPLPPQFFTRHLLPHMPQSVFLTHWELIFDEGDIIQFKTPPCPTIQIEHEGYPINGIITKIAYPDQDSSIIAQEKPLLIQEGKYLQIEMNYDGLNIEPPKMVQYFTDYAKTNNLQPNFEYGAIIRAAPTADIRLIEKAEAPATKPYFQQFFKPSPNYRTPQGDIVEFLGDGYMIHTKERGYLIFNAWDQLIVELMPPYTNPAQLQNNNVLIGCLKFLGVRYVVCNILKQRYHLDINQVR